MTTYGGAHPIYRDAGWPGPLPLKGGTKYPPPEGWTGWTAPYPSYADSDAWTDPSDYGDTTQLALRMADDVIGIDVDHYGEKRGADTLAEAERRWGMLPDAPRSSARGDGPSGIRFYRVPAGTTLRGKILFPELGLGDIEIIQKHHRYAVAWPSIHPSGTPYLWYDTAGPDSPPNAERLNDLPAAWIEANASTGEAGETAADPATVQTFARDHSGGTKTEAIRGVLGVWQRDAANGTRHDAMLSAVCMAAREVRAGHYPAATARTALRDAFVQALAEAKSGQRLVTPAESRREFDSMWSWAVAQALVLTPDEARARTGVRTSVPAIRPDVTVHAEAWPTTPSPTRSRLVNAGTSTIGAHALVDPPQLRVVKEDEPGTDVDRMVIDGEIVDQDEDRSSWAPVNLADILSGNHKPTPPEIMRRTDGPPLLYPGKVHSFHGESESGKSWLALIAAVEVLNDGGRVLFFDHESDAETICERLVLLGAKPADILERFTYVQPDQPIDAAEFPQLLAQPVRLCVIDGVTDAISAEGYNSNSPDEVSTWLRRAPKRIARETGAAVVMIDHVTKSREGRGRFAVGAQSKMNGLTGAAYTVDIGVPFGRGMVGEIVMRVGKDRPGQVRPHAGKASPLDRTAEVARVTIDSSNPGCIVTAVNPWIDEDASAETVGFHAVTADDWTRPDQAQLPDDIATHRGNGQKSILDLARFVRAHGQGGIGVDLVGAKAALKTLVVGGRPKHDRNTVERAWGALFDMGRIAPADSNTSGNVKGLHYWVPRENDPR